jgi:AcrR family transcriptional regulator
LTALLDAAAAVIDQIGYERLTTAMVAERAGASIGTVYRYFPDRIALLQALATRNLDRLLAKMLRDVADSRHSTFGSALGAALETYVNELRTQPGFRALRCGDVLDLRPAPSPTTFTSQIADELLSSAATRFGIDTSAESQFAIQTAIEVTDALGSRAFAREIDGDPAFLDQSRAIVRSVLAAQFGNAS